MESKKRKKPLLKRWWFWVLAVIIVGNVINAAFQESKEPEPEPTSSWTRAIPENTTKHEPVAAVVPTATPEPTPEPTPYNKYDVWVYVSAGGKKYHKHSNCGGHTYEKVSLGYAEDMGYEKCKKCY